MSLFDKFKKSPKEEINEHGKKFSLTTVSYADQVFMTDHQNPALISLTDEYSYDIEYVSLLADNFIACAKANAEIFSKETSLEQNDHLVHFFFDLYIVLNSGLIDKNTEVISIVIDAMHIKYFGPPSHNVVTSQLQLWAINEKCFLSSIFKILKQEDYLRLLATFAYYCTTKENLRASEALGYSELLLKMIKHFQPTVKREMEKR